MQKFLIVVNKFYLNGEFIDVPLNRDVILKEYRCKIFNAYDEKWLEFIAGNRIGAIAVILAKKLDIDNVRALKLFYKSKTCANLHDKTTGLYLYGDPYVVDEFMREMEY